MDLRAQMKEYVKDRLGRENVQRLKHYREGMSLHFRRLMYPYGRFVKRPLNLLLKKNQVNRRLEIGPGPDRITGFETLSAVWGMNVDYVSDASKKLPFPSGVFDLVYASHVLEHIPWYKQEEVLMEWVRIIRPGGHLEIWVPNGLLIAETFVKAEKYGKNEIERDGWYKFNAGKDPAVWANGRIFSYGDGRGGLSDPNWHRALFSPRYLENLLTTAGLVELQVLKPEDVRGHDHGWINLGYRGCKI